MSEFKVGDKVRYVDLKKSAVFSKDAVYEVIDVSAAFRKFRLHGKGLSSRSSPWFATSRFALADAAEIEGRPRSAVQTAEEILKLINKRPRSPTVEEILAILVGGIA